MPVVIKKGGKIVPDADRGARSWTSIRLPAP